MSGSYPLSMAVTVLAIGFAISLVLLAFAASRSWTARRRSVHGVDGGAGWLPAISGGDSGGDCGGNDAGCDGGGGGSGE